MESDCSAGLLLTSAGTSRLRPRCWLKERHQASVYPFMLGTYFFTVSSLSLSHTPSSLWIYRKTSNRAEHSHAILLLWKQEGQHPLSHSRTPAHIQLTPLRLQEKSIKLEDGNLFRQGIRNNSVLIVLVQRWLLDSDMGVLYNHVTVYIQTERLYKHDRTFTEGAMSLIFGTWCAAGGRITMGSWTELKGYDMLHKMIVLPGLSQAWLTKFDMMQTQRRFLDIILFFYTLWMVENLKYRLWW